ncbi:hypothetical protein JCM15519_16810 [Fundidesulfovibrio butyratiphilus]
MTYFNALLGQFSPYSSKLANVLTCLMNRTLASGGLAIKAAASAVVKTAAAISYSINGKLYSFAAGDVALTSVAASTVAAGNARVFFLFLDSAGDFSIVASDEVAVASLASVAVMPEYDCDTLVPFGAIKVSNGTASTFTPGTTALDTASLTVAYVNLSGIVSGQAI